MCAEVIFSCDTDFVLDEHCFDISISLALTNIINCDGRFYTKKIEYKNSNIKCSTANHIRQKMLRRFR